MVPTWDLVLLVFFAASLIYGFLMGKDKILVTILGAYVGLVIANQWGDRVFNFVAQQTEILNTGWMQGSLSIFVAKVVLFAFVLLIIAMKGGWLVRPVLGGGGVFGMVLPLVYSMASAVLIAASVLDFLPEETRGQVIEKSMVAAPLVHYYAVWLVLPVIIIWVSSWFTKE
ncbi:MAG: hypothetical protein V1807_02195 [Patescibacteria group bacterium]